MTAQIANVQRGLGLFPGGSGDVYRLLERLLPGLMLDVGAAAGWMSKAMLTASPQSRVIAFEPFPGNHRFIDSNLGDELRARIIKKAVANHNRPTKFHVPSVITNGTGAWAGMDGYSSVGLLVSDSDPRAANAITVETCRLDDLVSEPIRFMKIDVQGGEFEVLDGARRLFDHHGVELILTEFTGDERILSFLAERGYTIFDMEYHSSCPLGPLSPEAWRILSAVSLSTGRTAVKATPLNAPQDPSDYCAWFKSEYRRYRSLWTDLVAVAPWSGLVGASGTHLAAT
jgi:FkbM family methyltransferase